MRDASGRVGVAASRQSAELRRSQAVHGALPGRRQATNLLRIIF